MKIKLLRNKKAISIVLISIVFVIVWKISSIRNNPDVVLDTILDPISPILNNTMNPILNITVPPEPTTTMGEHSLWSCSDLESKYVIFYVVPANNLSYAAVGFDNTYIDGVAYSTIYYTIYENTIACKVYFNWQPKVEYNIQIVYHLQTPLKPIYVLAFTETSP